MLNIYGEIRKIQFTYMYNVKKSHDFNTVATSKQES